MTLALTLGALITFAYMLRMVWSPKNFVFVFLLIQGAFYLPFIFLADLDVPEHRLLLQIHLLYFVLIICFSIWFSTVFRQGRSNLDLQVVGSASRVRSIDLLLLLLSVGVSSVYYYANGGLIFMKLAQSTDISGIRLAFYAGEKYTGAGYVNQFKNTLMPLTAVALYWHTPPRNRKIVGILLAIILVPLISGTGQRFPIALTGVSLLYSVYILLGRRVRIQAIITIAALVSVFGFMSLLGQRTDEFSIVSNIDAVLTRILFTNQSEVVATFHYLVQRGNVAGLDWIEDFIGLAPGAKPSRLSNILYSIIFVTDRGTSPPSLASSLYFNFWYLGLIFGAMFQAWAINFLQYRMLIRRQSISRFLGIVFLAVILSTWTSGTFLTALNRGTLAVVIYLFLIRLTFVARRRAEYNRIHADLG